MTSFEELEFWKLCRVFRNEIRDITTKFPNEEKYNLIDQIVRSSRGVTAIAEGFGRFHHQENIQFCRIAQGSLYETLDHLICAHDNLYIIAEELEIQRGKYETCLKLLNGYIGYLKKAKQS